MSSLTVDEAQSRLREIIASLSPGEEVVILRDAKPVARLIGAAASTKVRKLGTLSGTIKYMASDFDDSLDDFKEYMS